MTVTPLEFQSNHTLAVVQFAGEQQDTVQYISIDAAMKDDLIDVREISDAGSVNHIFVLNNADQPVFIMDGDILLGAKQNRVVNTSILLAPKSKSTVPVSCVESGRWRHVSPRFSSSPYTAPMSLRSSKSEQVSENLSRRRGHTSDQGAIWNSVAALHESHKMSSPTQSLSDLYEHRDKDFSAFIRGFKAVEEANGLALFSSHELLSIDVFNRRDVYAEYFPKLLRGAAVDLFARTAKDTTLDKAEAFYRTVETLDALEILPRVTHQGVSLGQEQRFADDERVGFALEFDGQLIHFSALRSDRGKRNV